MTPPEAGGQPGGDGTPRLEPVEVAASSAGGVVTSESLEGRWTWRVDFSAHEWSVLAPLALVGFFTNYDTGLLTLAAPDIAAGRGVSVAVVMCDMCDVDSAHGKIARRIGGSR